MPASPSLWMISSRPRAHYQRHRADGENARMKTTGHTRPLKGLESVATVNSRDMGMAGAPVHGTVEGEAT
jgi:hypothetical protein